MQHLLTSWWPTWQPVASPHTCVMAAGSLSLETSTIPVDSYWLDHNTGEWLQLGTQKKAMAATHCQQNNTSFNGRAQLASLEGSGSCSGVLSNTTASNSVLQVYLSRSWHFRAMRFWEVLPVNRYWCYYSEHKHN